MRLALGQMNATTGDLAGNGARIESLRKEAQAAKADLFLVPEMAPCGYPPPDLFDRSVQPDAAALLCEVTCRAGKTALLAGTFLTNPSKTGRPLFARRPDDVTEESLQARVRGMLLMAISNRLGRLLLTTGNEDELAVGCCTLYGGMAGGLAPISDLPLTRVYALATGIARPIDRAEYKRQRAAPGRKVSTKSFGSSRRIPIAQVSKA